MQDQKTWKITELRDGEAVEVRTGVPHAEALQVIHNAMYGGGGSLFGPREQSVPDERPVQELQLAA